MAGRLFITGDTHGTLEIGRLSHKNWPLGRELDRDDLVVILGDFGMPWTGSNDERYWLDWLERRPWTTCFIDGNHEGFPALADLPRERRFGDEIGVVSEHVLHLLRGHVYDLNGRRTWVMGGGTSVDAAWRTPGFDWFPEEIPSADELDYGESRLDAAGWQVDLVLTHDAPADLVPAALSVGQALPGIKAGLSTLNMYLGFIDTTFESLHKDPKWNIALPHWYLGHYHGDGALDRRHTLVYHDIIEVA